MSKEWKAKDIINASDLNNYEDAIQNLNTLSTNFNNFSSSTNSNISSINSDISSLSNAINNNATRLDNIIDLIYPIGSIYMTSDSTNPGFRWGNTKWMRFAEGRTIFGVADSGTFNGNGLIGGNETHTLTSAEMPEHTHAYVPPYMQYSSSFAKRTAPSKGGANTTAGLNHEIQFFESQYNTLTTGGGQSFSILPPYITTYIWQRVSLENEVFLVDPALAVGENNAISWNYLAKDGATIQFKTGNDGTYSSNPPAATYQEDGTDTTFYIKGTYNEISSEVSAILPIA